MPPAGEHAALLACCGVSTTLCVAMTIIALRADRRSGKTLAEGEATPADGEGNHDSVSR